MRRSAILAASLVTLLATAACAKDGSPAAQNAQRLNQAVPFVSFVADGAQVRVPLPKGYCALDAARPAEAAWLAQTRDNGYDVSFIDCNALEAARKSGEEIATAKHISVRYLDDADLAKLTLAEGCEAQRKRTTELPIQPTAEWRQTVLDAANGDVEASFVIGSSEQACLAASAFGDDGIAMEAFTIVGGRWIEIYAVDADRQDGAGLMAQYRGLVRLVANVQAASQDAKLATAE